MLETLVLIQNEAVHFLLDGFEWLPTCVPWQSKKYRLSLFAKKFTHIKNLADLVFSVSPNDITLI